MFINTIKIIYFNKKADRKFLSVFFIFLKKQLTIAIIYDKITIVINNACYY